MIKRIIFLNVAFTLFGSCFLVGSNSLLHLPATLTPKILYDFVLPDLGRSTVDDYFKDDLDRSLTQLEKLIAFARSVNFQDYPLSVQEERDIVALAKEWNRPIEEVANQQKQSILSVKLQSLIYMHKNITNKEELESRSKTLELEINLRRAELARKQQELASVFSALGTIKKHVGHVMQPAKNLDRAKKN